MIALTSVTSQLGHCVLQDLLETILVNQIVAVVRSPAKAQPPSQQDVAVRRADHSDETVLTVALQDVDKLLLISPSEVSQRAVQHHNVINTAKVTGVTFIAYTSLLHTNTSPLGLAVEYIETEQMLADSGIAYALPRSGWYTENHLISVPLMLEYGVLIGAVDEGKIVSTTRVDYAAAAIRVIAGEGYEGKIYKLTGDNAQALSDLATELSTQSGKNMVYQSLGEVDFAAALKSVGLPAGLTDMLADSDVDASKGGLFGDNRTLSTLIDRPITSSAESVEGTL